MNEEFEQMVEANGVELIDIPTEADEKAQSRRDRAGRCGQLRFWINPTTGRKVFYHWMCGVHELCSRCLTIRVNKYRGRVMTAAPVRWGKLSVADARRLLRGAGKKNYLKCPQRDDSIVVFVSAETAQEAERRTKLQLQWYNPHECDEAWWEEVVNTPLGKRISGSLGLPDDDKKRGWGGGSDDEPEVEIPVEELIITKGDQETAEAAVDAGIEDTGGLDPHDLDELKEALATRMQAIRTRLARAGCEYQIRRRKVSVRITRINWLSSTDIPPDILADVPF